jgi:hypothetical protein
MLVEEHDRGKVVACLICKTPIRVGGEQLDARSQASGVKEANDHGQWPKR